MAKKPDLDEPTRRIAERLLSMPPKPHDQMKLGKSKTAVPKKEKTIAMFDIIRPIDGRLIVLDKKNGIAREIIDEDEWGLWLHGLPPQSHAEFLRVFYPNGEVQS